MSKYQEALDIFNEIVIRVNYYGGYFISMSDLEHLIEATKILQELVDKATPKKPKKLDYKILLENGWSYECPICKCAIGINTKAIDYTQEEGYCPTCGQAIDWTSDE